MKQQQFIDHVVQQIKGDQQVIGVAVAGSFITHEIDEYSDVDLILVTKDKIAPDFAKMESYAKSFGQYLSGFTGEHVGEPRVLICLYDQPLLHVDIKFITLEEFEHRVENPVIVFDRNGSLATVISSTTAEWPRLDYQWIEDRFWTWVHYATLKLGRGENFEALDFFSFVRTVVISPLLQVRNHRLPRGLRKVEVNFKTEDLQSLIATVASYDTRSLFTALDNIVAIYRSLREDLFPGSVVQRTATELRALEYLQEVRKMKLG